MTKADLINEMAAQAEISKVAATKALDAMTMAMIKSLLSGDSVHLNGIGTFKVVYRNAYPSRNPKTGESVIVPASKRVKLSPSKRLKDAVNG